MILVKITKKSLSILLIISLIGNLLLIVGITNQKIISSYYEKYLIKKCVMIELEGITTQMEYLLNNNHNKLSRELLNVYIKNMRRTSYELTNFHFSKHMKDIIISIDSLELQLENLRDDCFTLTKLESYSESQMEVLESIIENLNSIIAKYTSESKFNDVSGLSSEINRVIIDNEKVLDKISK